MYIKIMKKIQQWMSNPSTYKSPLKRQAQKVNTATQTATHSTCKSERETLPNDEVQKPQRKAK